MISSFPIFRPNLTPHCHLEKSNHNDFSWSASNNDPQFMVSKLPPLFGWFMVELDIAHSSCGGDACIYFDVGEGFIEESKIFIPLKNNKKTKRIFYIPSNLKAIRFDPLDEKGDFSIKEFVFVWLLPCFAYDRMLSRMTNMHFGFIDKKKKNILKEVRIESKNSKLSWQMMLLEKYNQTFYKSKIDKDYEEWILNNEGDFESVPSSWLVRPKISILLPVYNTDEKFLIECISSVRSQTYDRWELCIVDDASTALYIKPIIKKASESDSRIKVVYRDKNGHISEATNTALVHASGDFITFLDHDDLLSENALAFFVSAINEYPEADLFYSDEDKIDQYGRRYDPFFKPDWNRDLLYSQNYICHMFVIRQSLVDQVGGFRSECDGSQDYDFLLRATKKLDNKKIHHLPLILYHWRATEESTANDHTSKNYTTDAGIRALRSLHAENNAKVNVRRGLLPNTYRNNWALPNPIPLVSIIIPTRDAFSHLKRCIESVLEKTSYKKFEIIIIDNQTKCPMTLEYMHNLNKLNFISVYKWDQPFNYSKINNYAAGIAGGSILCLLNNDVEVINDEWLTEMVSHASRNDIGCVGAKLSYPNDTIQHAGVVLGIGGVAGHSHKYFSRHDNGYFSRLKLIQNFSAVTGACLVLKKCLFEQVGGLDGKNLPVAFNDVDLCLKINSLGYRNLWTPYAELYHHESISRGKDDSVIKRNRAKREATFMRKKWISILDNDPAYNRNLTLTHEDFTLR